MSRFTTLFFISILVIVNIGCSERRPKKLPDHVNFSVLLERMTNVNTFAEAPWGNSFLVSSYDKTGGNQDWSVYTKADANGRIKILDVDGPGYVSRIWIASYAAKNWHFFFDGETEARLVLTQKELFGNKFPFAPPLAGTSGGGKYSLLPIPFSKSLRIEIEPTNLKASNRNYFQINYSLLDMTSDAVNSFPKVLSDKESNLAQRVNIAFSAKDDELRMVAQECMNVASSKVIPPGESLVFWDDAAAGLLKIFSVEIEDPNPSIAMSQELLRMLRLQMFWDTQESPSVDVPLGDFFCNPFYFREFTSLPLGNVDNTFVCRFPMPYKRGGRCLIKNTSPHTVTLKISAQGNIESSEGLNRKFHAVWRASKTSGRPLPMMEAQGSGHYVGCFMTAIGQDGSWNILEGDEYIRPDYGTQPPQLGTGLEDYFSGAYYYTSLFDLPFHGLIEKGAMRTDQYRFHMLESVAFDKTIDVGIEFGHGNRSKGYMSTVSYWYMDEAAAVPLNSGYLHLLVRPGDRFELQGLMAQFFLLERAGLYDDATTRIQFFAERYKAQPWVDMFKVRALGYREKTEGFASVKAEYEKLAKSNFPPAAKAASDQLWVHEDPDHALLGIHALAKYNISFDGQPIAQGEGKGELKVVRVMAKDGMHTWSADLKPTRQGSFFALCLRKQSGDVTSAGEWDILEKVDQPGARIPDVVKGSQVLPNMTIWALEPNAYVGMQSPPIGIQLWRFYDGAPMYQKLKISKTIRVGDTDQIDPLKEDARSDEELKANAVN